jgi:lipopolysaccharide export system permease protein
MGFRVFVGVVTGVTFRIVQDLLGPLSIVFGFPPFLAVITPVVFCAALGVYLLRRSG